MTYRYKGSCLCGQVKYSVTGFAKEASNCHCSMCLKFDGAAFGTLLPVTGLEWHQGRDLLKEYMAENGSVRTFCTKCGSSIGFKVGGASVGSYNDSIELAIANFDEEVPVRVTSQIYTSYKTNWYPLNPDIKIYVEAKVED